VNINVTPVRINNFALNPQIIAFLNQQGNQSTLTWDTSSQVLSIDQGIGTVPAKSNKLLTAPADGTTYTITAGTIQNPALCTQSVAVTNAYGPYTFNSFITTAVPWNQIFPPSIFPPIHVGVVFNIQNLHTSFLAAFNTRLMQVQFTGVIINGQTTPTITTQAYLINGSTSFFVPNVGCWWANQAKQSGTVTIISMVN